MTLRLNILNNGHSAPQKLVFKVIAATSEGIVPGPIRTMSYRRGFFGKHLATTVQQAMRSAKNWTVGEIELFAAFVSNLNQCEY